MLYFEASINTFIFIFNEAQFLSVMYGKSNKKMASHNAFISGGWKWSSLVDNIAADQFSVDFSKYYLPTTIELPFPSLFFIIGKTFPFSESEGILISKKVSSPRIPPFFFW